MPARGAHTEHLRSRVRAARVPSRVAAALLVLAGAPVLAAVFGPGYAGYDAAWALVWGAELAAGRLPSYDTALAPTPHPLANLVAAPLSVLADGGEWAVVALSFVSLATLIAGAATLATGLGGALAGVLAAGLVTLNATLARSAAFASVDVPALALVVWALALEARRPRETLAPVALLSVAGLLRPEVWGLALALAVWTATGPGTSRPRARAALAVGVSAPVLWSLSDLLVTGEPLFSLTGTQALAETLDRPRGLGTSLEAVPEAVRELVGVPAAVAGLAGAGLLLSEDRSRAAAPLGALVLATAAFAAIGAAGLPVLFRYMLVPGVLLLVLAAVAAAAVVRGSGWQRLLGGACVLLLAAAVVDAGGRLEEARDFTAARGAVHRDLRAIASSAPFQRAARACGTIVVPDFRTRPVVLLEVEADPSRLRIGNLPDRQRGLLLTYGSDSAALIFNLGAPGEVRRQARPLAARTIGENASWRAYATC